MRLKVGTFEEFSKSETNFKKNIFDRNILKNVERIVCDIREGGDSCLRRYSLKFDKVELNEFRVSDELIRKAYSKIKERYIKAIKKCAETIKKFALKQKNQYKDFEFEIKKGVFTGQKVIPIESIAVYVPGGRFPLVSTLLMGAIPAKAAGVKRIVIISPPKFKGSIHPAILVASDIIGIDEIYMIGGAQAIAALAYGTETIKPVEKIVGPGNNYVNAAKKIVYGDVGIDFIAGPTEVAVIADKTANPFYIAADLIAQAEHDVNAIPLLITNSISLANSVNNEVESKLKILKTREVAEQSIKKNGKIIIVKDLIKAVKLANDIAPEHLELHVKNPCNYIDKLLNYGSLFLGKYSAEVFGDYSSGLNHTLPTNRVAKYTGGLSIKDFLKIQTTLRVEKEGVTNLSEALDFAELEGLDGHFKAAEIRIKNQE